MGAENFVEAPKSGNRKARRARVLLAVRLETDAGNEIEGRLRDLSRKGALVECMAVPPVGSQVTFKRGKTIVPARIAWTGGNRVGLEFAFMIDESELLVQLGGKPDESAQRYRRPRLFDELSEQDRKRARVWGASVGLAVPGE
ncbi:PilZ domain-containing protein [Sphingosinicella rhizophila]|uniref:PilZ domain-containing protein n=1 Tax=Sphingosinicella rhizophila TaxID=3050082 RepID=A0ABU3Q7C7_9SPHN|nr:PilZ domain-containing protein [Sphingosinicella sp. GR2756]MDT9599313.1 PilZ domain-containing protein [Sphingosinicella sp. GR2756]